MIIIPESLAKLANPVSSISNSVTLNQSGGSMTTGTNQTTLWPLFLILWKVLKDDKPKDPFKGVNMNDAISLANNYGRIY
ncbi:hypothetical protein CYY_002392 [Polysphondylium violaceum]|uniref:Uncharacterized protein n=1 Tax=Polysphondylium violaceum TaxID=133409 RepID=A0A8J4V6X5_9MYCE|nr:hypothetical protein CYY_002392 [Polysphondylium violaceum]